jgi:hypothetical protein
MVRSTHRVLECFLVGCGCYGNRYSSFGIATCYWIDGLGTGVWFLVGGRNISSIASRLALGAPSGYQGLFPRGKSVRDLKLTTCLHLVLRSRMVKLFPLRGSVFMTRSLILKHRSNSLKFMFSRPSFLCEQWVSWKVRHALGLRATGVTVTILPTWKSLVLLDSL